MSPADIITAVIAALSLAVAIVALVRGERSTRAAIRSADAADRSADEATRTNTIAEREATAAQAERDANRHSWHIERDGKHGLRLHNGGTEDATNVTVDLGEHPADLTRNTPTGVAIPSRGVSETFTLIEAMGHPTPNAITVSCDQHPARPVPIPPS